MPADLAALAAEPVLLDTIPTLESVLVIDEAQGAHVVRAARADLAQLSLQLRAVTGTAAPAEVQDLTAASVLLQASLERTIEGRRQELRAELEEVRSDAAAQVAGAREDAASMVAEATDATLQTLLRGIRPTTAPRLRVVSDPDLGLGLPPTPARITADPAVPPPVPASALDAIGPSDSPPRPVAAPRLEASVQQAVAAALADVFSGAARLAGLEAPAVVPAVAYEAAAARIAAPLANAFETSATPAVRPAVVATGRTGVGRFLYADVLLPMVAVVIVLVILLAWVG